MRDLTSIEALRELPRAAEVFDALGDRPEVHAVGGAVRDVRLGRRPTEVDLVVVGDATVVARELAERLAGHVRVHERFKTATLQLGSAHFDFTSARRESYPRPGALPEVQPGASLAEDLERRDFTVNAIAVSLADGRVTAHPGALEDLDARMLRVLHPASFRDDPTRLLRMARYAGRLSLIVEATTAQLAQAAVAGGALETVSGERVGRELRLAAGEPQPQTLRVLVGAGVASAVLGEAEWDEPALVRALAICPPDGRQDLLALASLTVAQDTAALAARLRHLAFPREEAERVLRVAAGAPRLAAALRGTAGAPPSHVWELLAREPAEAVALAGGLSDSPEALATAERFLTELRHVRPSLSGTDLENAGLRGREVGEGLRAARAAVLDSPAAGREEQLAAALATVRSPPDAAG